MDKPEKVGLVFPRSGQQLYVNLPAQIAQSMSGAWHQERAAVMEQPTHAPRYAAGDDSPLNR